MQRVLAILIASLAFGALSGVAAYLKVRPAGVEIVDPRTLVPAIPFAAYGGLKVKF